ncbi:hypothetical protein L1987_15986 [Smallanthus sonchifolius]|uniref:Uncharacterized protein n=1 Tax=Smallanthus sonchifolius TaxID=185202 RepID=A0ACB9J738_9ASTR|nr:hypothetical protein L1987_15986 [Smallanthus sonchifolius]
MRDFYNHDHPTNPLNTNREINKQIADSKPLLAFTTSDLVPKLADSNLPIVLIGTGAGNRRIVNTLEQMMTTEPNRNRIKERVTQDDTATLLYSSGTTGASKGVISSDRNLIAMVQTVIGRFQLEDEHQTFLCTVPMFHIYGLVAFATGLIASGATVVVLSKFEIHEMLSAIGSYNVSYLPLVRRYLLLWSTTPIKFGESTILKP